MDIQSLNLEYFYTFYNAEYFSNTLPAVEFITIRWNYNLGNLAGVCKKNYKETVIEISPIYISLYPEEFPSILIHEMIHLISMEHDETFLREAARISDMGIKINVNCQHDIYK